MEEPGKESVLVMHEKIRLSLLHVDYDVVISPNALLAKEVIEDIIPGATLENVTADALSFVAGVGHPILGNRVVVYINPSTTDPAQPLAGIIAHESINVAWKILNVAHIKINEDNRELLGYVVSEIVNELTDMVQSFHEKTDDLEDL
jgi:hypothetical protein